MLSPGPCRPELRMTYCPGVDMSLYCVVQNHTYSDRTRNRSVGSHPNILFYFYSCVFAKCSYRVLVRVFMCVSVFLHDNSKSNRSRNIKFEYIVVHENISDKFDIGHCRTNIKVTARLRNFSPFTTIQLSGPNSTLVAAGRLIFSMYVHVILIYKIYIIQLCPFSIHK